MSRSLAPLGVTFVAVVVLVVGAAAVSPLILGQTADGGPPEVENPHYEDPSLVNDRSPGTADVSLDSDEPSNTVLIDAAPRITDRQLRPLVTALSAAGHDVEFREPLGGGSLDRRLDQVDALVIVGNAGQYGAEDAEAVADFADEGGRVVIATDPGDAFGQAGGSTLESELGVYAQPGYAYNLRENDLNYQRVFAEPDGEGALTDGVDRAVFSTATPVGAAEHDTAFRGIEGTQLSTSREPTDAPVLVRDGNVVLIGDTLFLSPENAQRADNDVLIGNVGDFLVTGDYETTDGGGGGF